ncbi:MAG: co-chaperone GroES [Fibrobacterales bacterium]
MAIQPLADRVVLEQVEAEEKTAGGLYIPDNAKEKPAQGKVVAVGPGKTADNGELIAPELKKGDVVLYGKYAGTEIEDGSKKYLIMRESDILAKIGK